VVDTYIPHSSFTSIIPNETWPRSGGSNGSNVDDRTPLALIDEVRDKVSRCKEDRLYIDIEDFIEFILDNFQRWLFFPSASYSPLLNPLFPTDLPPKF